MAIKRDLASADYLRSIGTAEELLPYMIEQELAARKNDAERQQSALLRTQLAQVRQMYEEGEIESLKSFALQLASAGQTELAEMVAGYGYVEEDGGTEARDYELLEQVEDTPWSGINDLIQTTKATAAQQAAEAAQEAANARGHDLLQIGADAARAYATQGLADAAARIVAGKLVSGEASPSTEAEMVQLVNDGARMAAVDTTRLREVDEELEASFRAHTKGFGGRNLPYQTQSELDVYREQWLTRNRPGVLAKYAPSDADYAPGPTAEELTAQQVDRVERKMRPSFAPDAFDRAKAAEAERNSRRGGLDSSWDQARGIKTASPALAAELGDVAEVVSDR